MIWLLLLGALTALFWYKFVKPLNYWDNKSIAHTKPWPIFGDMLHFSIKKMSFVELIKKLYNMYPRERYMGFFQFTKPILLLRDPELIKQITVKDFDHFTDHKTAIDPEIDPLLGKMLFVLTGQKWREMRATLSGAFTSSKMKNMFHLIDEAADNFVNFFKDKNEDLIEIEMKDTYTRLTNDVIATSAFGIQCNSLANPNNEFYLMGKEATNFSRFSTIFKTIGYAVIPKLLKKFGIHLFPVKVATFFKSIINETIKIREEKGIVRPDMINLLLEAKKGIKQEEKEVIETGYATVTESAYNGKVRHIKDISNELITSQALIFFIAGFDTVSTAMCFGTHELAVNKEIQDRLRDEIKETHKKCNGKLTYEVLLKMKYLDMVVSEIIRMWPPATAVDRVCTKPYVIEPVNPKESRIFLKVDDIVLLQPITQIHTNSILNDFQMTTKIISHLILIFHLDPGLEIA